MKRNISDLLDAYIDESVDLNGTSLLSSSRIKELTLSRINQKNTATMLEQGGQGRIRKLLSRLSADRCHNRIALLYNGIRNCIFPARRSQNGYGYLC